MEFIPGSHLIPIPVYGKIPTGTPRELFDVYADGYIYLPYEVVSEEDIAFKVIDNDISWDEVGKGDYIIVATYLQPYDGAMALARVDRSSITVKRLKYRDDKVILLPADDDYEPMEFSKEEVSERLEIIGVVKGIMKPKRWN